MAELSKVGSPLGGTEPRACGLCGDVRKLSRSHVPPQVAGNTTKVRRAADVIDAGIRRPGTWHAGGMWVRGLCEPCNNRAGREYDVAYADLAAQTRRLTSPIARHMQVFHGEPPGARLAPGLVARCVLYGMFAISPRLRLLFPELAHDLLHEKSGEGPIRWPSKLRLLLGLTDPSLPTRAVVSSGIMALDVIGPRTVHHSFGDIAFPPLTWVLEPPETQEDVDTLGPRVTRNLSDVSDWLNYGPDRTSVDLRNICHRLPVIALPALVPSNSRVEMLAQEVDGIGAVVLFGDLSHAG